jgi:hypothetical protein
MSASRELSVQIVPSTANNMTGTAVVTSSVVRLKDINQGSIQAIWTGTPVGVFDVQASLDYSLNPDGSVRNAGHWASLGASLSAPAGSASNALVDLALTGVPWIRLVYTNASGTGTLSALLYGKGI